MYVSENVMKKNKKYFKKNCCKDCIIPPIGSIFASLFKRSIKKRKKA
jgi:hypothetical protein